MVCVHIYICAGEIVIKHSSRTIAAGTHTIIIQERKVLKYIGFIKCERARFAGSLGQNSTPPLRITVQDASAARESTWATNKSFPARVQLFGENAQGWGGGAAHLVRERVNSKHVCCAVVISNINSSGRN